MNLMEKEKFPEENQECETCGEEIKKERSKEDVQEEEFDKFLREFKKKKEKEAKEYKKKKYK